MLNRNRVWIGLLLGLALPLAGFMVLYSLLNLLETKGAASSIGLSSNFRERTSAIVAIALNLILMNQYLRRRWDASLRGVVIATAILALVWVGRYGVGLF